MHGVVSTQVGAPEGRASMGRTTTAIWFAIAAPFALMFLVAATQDDSSGLDPRANHPFVSVEIEDADENRAEPHSRFIYTVQPGDTLDGVASLFGLDRATLLAANSMPEADNLVARMKLIIPLDDPGMEYTDTALRAKAMVLREAEATYGLPRGLLLALAWQESHWDQSAVSYRGAVGIGQLMPSTARWIEETIVGRPLDWRGSTRDNAHAAAAYLAYLLDRADGDVWLALAGYYQGAHSVDTEGAGPTTPAYVEGVLRLVPRYQ